MKMFWPVCLWMAAGAFGESSPQADSAHTIPVFENADRKLYERPLFYVAAGDPFKAVERAGDKVKIAIDGKTGWIDQLSMEKTGGSQQLWMKELKVFGFLDNPEPIYILDFDHEAMRSIRMDRDFVYDSSLTANLDREKFEWENEVYYYKGVEFKPELVEHVQWLKK